MSERGRKLIWHLEVIFTFIVRQSLLLLFRDVIVNEKVRTN